MTHADKMLASESTLQTYKGTLVSPADDAEIAKVDEHLAYRMALKTYGSGALNKAKNGGMGPGGLESPPVPPIP